MIKPELLAPAGNLEKLKAALLYGADAVFMGGKKFGLRALGGNFSDEELRDGIVFAHERGKKAYVTVNIFPHNADLPELPAYLQYLAAIGADGILVADLGVYRMARRVAPELALHVSTQANATNWAAVEAWREMGAKRVVLARELSLAEIEEIRRRTTVELEIFVHGAMCISYSGRCLMSHYLAGRDANRGACAQPCRWRYSLLEETRPGESFPVLEDERGAYVFNSKDLCLLPHLPRLIASGVNSFKIEGRMKSVHYVATVVGAYRQAIDSYAADPDRFSVQDRWREELAKVSHRAYTTGFYFNKASADDQIYTSSSYLQTHDFIGLVLSYDAASHMARVEQRNHMKAGQTIEILGPGGASFIQTIGEMTDEDGRPIEAAPHPQQIVRLKVDRPVEPYAMLRRRKEAADARTEGSSQAG